MSTQRLQFPGGNGHQLSAQLDLPEDAEPRACVVFAHCFTCTKDIKAFRDIGRALSGQGFALMRFDFTGLGGSDGDFSDTNFGSNTADVLAAAEYLRSRFQTPLFLMGHSLGGTACLAASGQAGPLAGVITLGAPAHPGFVARVFQDKQCDVEASGSAEISLGGSRYLIGEKFFEDLRLQELDSELKQLHGPLLVLHAPEDELVPFEHGLKLFDGANPTKSFVGLDGADHLLSSPRDAQYVGEILACWLSRHLE